MSIVFRVPKRVFAVCDKSKESLAESASGGAFPLMARPILETGGVVFGAIEDRKGNVFHCGVSTIDRLSELQGSKYTQSKTGFIFREVGDLLKQGKKVLFSGTPCQCSGLCSYLQEKRIIANLEQAENLLVCDLICHGVPSNELYKRYLSWLGGKVHADNGIESFAFRSKKQGWGLNYHYHYHSGGVFHEVCESCDESPYYAAFLRGNIYRDSCYKCMFARRERIGDVTIGDYWGIETAHPGFECRGGASVVLLNTEKGNSFFEDYCLDKCDSRESTFELASRENKNLSMPTPCPEERKELMALIEKAFVSEDFSSLFDIRLRPKGGLKRILKNILPAAAITKLKVFKQFVKGR